MTGNRHERTYRNFPERIRYFGGSGFIFPVGNGKFLETGNFCRLVRAGGRQRGKGEGKGREQGKKRSSGNSAFPGVSRRAGNCGGCLPVRLESAGKVRNPPVFPEMKRFFNDTAGHVSRFRDRPEPRPVFRKEWRWDGRKKVSIARETGRCFPLLENWRKQGNPERRQGRAGKRAGASERSAAEMSRMRRCPELFRAGFSLGFSGRENMSGLFRMPGTGRFRQNTFSPSLPVFRVRPEEYAGTDRPERLFRDEGREMMPGLTGSGLLPLHSGKNVDASGRLS